MSWAEFHSKSELLAGEAETAIKRGDLAKAEELYALAADAEIKALNSLDRTKVRTLGITFVSAISLSYKAKQFPTAEKIAYQGLSEGILPEFAVTQLKEFLQTLWNEVERQKAGVKFVPGQVTVAIKGGEVVRGGAPLDLIVEKVQVVQSLFFRTAEFLTGLPHRIHGGPNQEIRQMCRPWLFQATPGSYQFAVAVQEPLQSELFPSGKPKSQEVASKFLQILRASTEDPDTGLSQIVPNTDYRKTFLKLTRNLAPTGKTYQSMEVQAPGDTPVILMPSERKTMGEVIRRQRDQEKEIADRQEITLTGILRAVHLDKDWLEVMGEKEHIRVEGIGDTVDDIIGPMVNRPVIIQTVKDTRGHYHFRDIEPAE